MAVLTFWIKGNSLVDSLRNVGPAAQPTAVTTLNTFGHSSQESLRSVHPADAPTGHHASLEVRGLSAWITSIRASGGCTYRPPRLSRGTGTPCRIRFEMSGRRPNLPPRQLSIHAGTPRMDHFDPCIRRMHLPATTPLSRYGDSLSDSLRNVGPAAQPTAATTLNTCGHSSHGSLRSVHPADAPTGHHASLEVRGLLVGFASKCRAGGPTYRRDNSQYMRVLPAWITSIRASGGCTYRAPRLSPHAGTPWLVHFGLGTRAIQPRYQPFARSLRNPVGCPSWARESPPAALPPFPVCPVRPSRAPPCLPGTACSPRRPRRRYPFRARPRPA
ncbi:hypothetical protein SCOR_25230 [Sulfidibacter corallicola]